MRSIVCNERLSRSGFLLLRDGRSSLPQRYASRERQGNNTDPKTEVEKRWGNVCEGNTPEIRIRT